jgi:hypothetical protein
LGAANYGAAIDLGRRNANSTASLAGVMAVVRIPNYQRLVEQTRMGKATGEWKIAHGQGVSTQRIADGASRTVVLSELLPWDVATPGTHASVDIRGVWVSASMGASTYTHKYGPNSAMPDRINACDGGIPRAHPQHCEQTRPTGEEAAETWASARSAHRGGVVAAAADGSVKFYADDIFLPVWQALATRDGGEL